MMTNLTSSETLSSLHIEPVNMHEYNRSLIVQLSSHHKRKFLQCIQSEPNFLSAPESYPNLFESLVSELNCHNTKRNHSEWLKKFRAWMDVVSSSATNTIQSNEDKKLSELISMQQPKHFHRVGAASGQQSIKALLSHCRICLASSSTKMVHLFNEGSTDHQYIDETTLLEKLNHCSCFIAEANVDDGLPQYICTSCSILIENAYQLKILCEKTEAKLHELQQPSIVRSAFETKQQPRTPNVKVEQIDVSDSNVNPNSSLINTELREDVDLIEMDNTNAREQFSSNGVKPQTKIKGKSNDSGNAKSASQCEKCCKWFRKASLTIHMRSHTDERPYICEVCGKRFKTTSAAYNHRVVHMESKDFKCSQCAFSTNTKSNLKIHERIHSGIQPYECKFCAMKFRTASNVVKHMRNIHEKQKSNKCDKCHRSFFTRESLRKHSIIHMGLKPFSCPQASCSVSYAWYNGLKKHIRTHHSNENVKIAPEKVFFEKYKNLLP